MSGYDAVDSDEVLRLKDWLERIRHDSSDGARDTRKWLGKQIRAQRLSEARDRGTHTDEEWNAILAEFSYRCVKCGCVPIGRPCKDHIVPLYLGGSDGADNLQPLCRECNTGKRNEPFNWAQYRREHGFETENE